MSGKLQRVYIQHPTNLKDEFFCIDMSKIRSMDVLKKIHIVHPDSIELTSVMEKRYYFDESVFGEIVFLDEISDLLKAVEKISDPPGGAEFLVGAFSKKRYRAALLQALSEDFGGDLAAGMSLRRARLRYWAAALNSIGPQMLAALKRIGVVGLVFDAARRWIR